MHTSRTGSDGRPCSLGDADLTHLLCLLSFHCKQDKERRQAVLRLALARADAPLLSTLLAQPGFSTAGASLHAAVRSLPRELVQRLVLTGAGINQRDEHDGSLLMHKASGWGWRVGVGLRRVRGLLNCLPVCFLPTYLRTGSQPHTRSRWGSLAGRGAGGL